MILEVSRKQQYIFNSNKLKENADRSGDIDYVTSSRFFADAAGDRYDAGKNLVYTGGGHTVLQFDGREAARSFAAEVSAAAMERFPGMELFVKLMDYDPGRTASENLKELSRQLEEKKALRAGSFRRMSLGVEALGRELSGDGDQEGFLPVRVRRPDEPKLPLRPDYNFARLLPEPCKEAVPCAYPTSTGLPTGSS